jgi:DnaJ domain
LNRLNASRDYYAILGASEDTSPRDIEVLYKRLAHQRHPDCGGSEEEMKALNEAYQVLGDRTKRAEYDLTRRKPAGKSVPIQAAPAAREVGVYGQILSALLCLMLGLILLLLVRFNGLWFLWPLSILALGVILFGVMIAHSAVANARDLFAVSHPARRFRVAQEIAFWGLVFGSAYAVYLLVNAI